MLALCSMLLRTYYAHFNAGIIGSPLIEGQFELSLEIEIAFVHLSDGASERPPEAACS